MARQEKKYLVESLAAVALKLHKLAQKGDTSESIHYYADQPHTNDVSKLVVHGKSAAIHILKEHNGTFTLTQNIPVTSTLAGLDWLKQHGHSKVGVVAMTCTEYAYKGGVVGLYTINGFLYSVILEFESGQHDAIAKELGLENAETITAPYNKLLEQLDKLKQLSLND